MKPNAPLVDIPDEFRAAVVAQLLVYAQFDPGTSCVNYTGYKTPSGYGRFEVAQGDTHLRIRAHRATWILGHGPIADPALVVDHLCRNRGCINPEHLELITNEENLHRGDDHRGQERRVFIPGSTLRQRRRVPVSERTSCTNGHPWPEFLKIDRAGRGRCLACKPATRKATSKATERSSCLHGHPCMDWEKRKRAAARVGA